MHAPGLRFSIATHFAWAPGLTLAHEWDCWAREPFPIGEGADPALAAMPAMLRRRAGFLGKMALEVAYQCLNDRTGVPTVFCSRHGEVGRAIDLLGELAAGQALSPTSFGLAVHNASAGLFSIARADRANHIALAGGQATVEQGVVEACGLLADGAPQVLLVVYDCPLPALLARFEDCTEQPFAWAWLMTAPGREHLSLSLETACEIPGQAFDGPGGLDVLRFYRSGQPQYRRRCEGRDWVWTRHV